jgi:GT2 family glycosyltransferase
VSTARNVGASHSGGDILFFTDADCLLNEDAVAKAVERLSTSGEDVVLGGTYTVRPADDRFFSAFQSAFINHFESREEQNPDYIATHAMVMRADTFRVSCGFIEGYLPIIEDVHFSHRMRESGHRLVMDPRIQVRHVFNYSFLGSVRNGFTKAKYWTIYSIHNKDLLADSGTASRALKFNVLALLGSILVAMLVLGTGHAGSSVIIALLMAANIVINSDLLRAFHRARGIPFGLAASAYYLLVYPLVVGAGGLAGILSYRRFDGLLDSAG